MREVWIWFAAAHQYFQGASTTALFHANRHLRQRTLRPVGEQAVIVHRMIDPEKPADDSVQPPDWVDNRDTLRFLLAMGSARIPGESQFICLSTDSSVLVDVMDTPGSALPELCFTLPSGEILVRYALMVQKCIPWLIF